VKVGEEVEIVGFRDTRKTVVTGVEMFKSSWTKVWLATRRAIAAWASAKEDVERGMVWRKWIDHAAHQVQG